MNQSLAQSWSNYLQVIEMYKKAQRQYSLISAQRDKDRSAVQPIDVHRARDHKARLSNLLSQFDALFESTMRDSGELLAIAEYLYESQDIDTNA